MLKEQKGITLIALVITIIVLLILAGVSIAMIAGRDGVAQKAGDAVIKDALAAGKDAVGLVASDNLAKFYDEKYVSNKTGAKLTYSSAQAAVVDAGKTAKAKGVTIAVVEGEDKIKITSDKDATYYTTGTVDDNGGINWVDKIPAE